MTQQQQEYDQKQKNNLNSESITIIVSSEKAKVNDMIHDMDLDTPAVEISILDDDDEQDYSLDPNLLDDDINNSNDDNENVSNPTNPPIAISSSDVNNNPSISSSKTNVEPSNFKKNINKGPLTDHELEELTEEYRVKFGKVAVIVEPRPSPILEPLILHFDKVLGPEWKCKLVYFLLFTYVIIRIIIYL